MIYDGDWIVLSTGRRVYANGGVLGLGPSGVAHEGYDGWLSEGQSEPFSPAERREIAEHMITLWRAWGEATE